MKDIVLDTEVWTWGCGSHGQLGLGDRLDSLQPVKVKQLSDKRVTKVTSGARHSLALTADAQVNNPINLLHDYN